jgi:hypothetical protein
MSHNGPFNLLIIYSCFLSLEIYTSASSSVNCLIESDTIIPNYYLDYVTFPHIYFNEIYKIENMG